MEENEKKKIAIFSQWWFWTIIGVAALAMIGIIIAVSTGNNGGSNQPNTTAKESPEIVWDSIVLKDKLPELKGRRGDVVTNNKDSLSIYVHDISWEIYDQYAKDCKERGYTIDVKDTGSSYKAYNSEGYKVSLSYDGYRQEYNIALRKPLTEGMKENAWISTEVSKVIPEPESKYGRVSWEGNTYYYYYAGNTSKEAYAKYADLLIKSGFDKSYLSGEDGKYYKGDEYFSAQNEEGYSVSVTYEGFNVMYISISDPYNKKETKIEEKTETKNETKVEETKPVEEPKKEETKPAENTSTSSGSTGLGKEFKEAMDSYEAFVDEYCAFMKKYSKSNGTDMSLLADYAKYVSKLSDMSSKFEKWNSGNMNSAEQKYYLEVQTRTSKKLLEASTSN